MIKSYLKLAWRNIFRKKLYSFINITGLGFASAFCILVYLYLQHENSFDKFHSNEKQLYRLESNDIFGFIKPELKRNFISIFNKKQEEPHLIQTPVILAGDLQKRFPEIEEAVRIKPERELIVRVKNQSFKESGNAAFVDPKFFSVFSFPLLSGNSTTILTNHDEVVLSEKVAIKYFGKTNPIGQTIVLSNREEKIFTVTGVAKDFPSNSSFKYDLLFHRESLKDYEQAVARGLNTYTDFLIIKLKNGINPNVFEQNLNSFGKQYFYSALKEMATMSEGRVKPEQFRFFLVPFSDAHFSYAGNWGHYTDRQIIYQLIFLALITLFIAGFNYVLLSLTGAISRSHEVGIRKTIGAAKKQIVLQFYIETQILAFLSVFIGFVIAVLCMPLFNKLIGETMQMEFFSFGKIISGLFLFAISVGIITGIYPALVLAGLTPVKIMRKYSIYRLNPFLSKSFGVVQFAICIVLIICSIVVTKQIGFINKAKLGFDKDLIVAIQNPYSFENKQNTFQLRDRLVQYASTEPAIADITTTWFPFQGYNTNGHLIGEEKISIQDFNIDYNYFSFFNIPIVKGRNFSKQITSDSVDLVLNGDEYIEGSSTAKRPVIVNETLFNLLGQPELNKINREIGAPIIGVCKDYHADNLTKKIAPAYHRIEKGYIGFFWVKIKPAQPIPIVMNKLKSNWKSLTSGEPFSYTFLEEDIAKSYDEYLRWMRTVITSCLLSIIIACLGMFGLSGITTLNRIKEIGIRKVLGASVSELFILLNKSSIIITIISFTLAVPIAVYLLNQWLQNFAYRIKLDWTLFLIGGIISALTALMAVSYHTIKTARENPVKSLRTE